MNILITGGSGFIGSYLIKRLISLHHKLILLKRSNTDLWRIKNIVSKCKVYNIDQSNSYDKIFTENKIDIIIHLATKYVKYEEDEKDIKEMINTNIFFPTLLLDRARKFNVKFFINTGTCFEYKRLRRKLKETDETLPFNFYSSTKLAFEEILKYYSTKYDIKAVTLRLFYPYGERDNDYKLIPSLILALLKNQEIKLTKGEQRLDFTYVDDIVEAYVKTIKKIKSLRNNYSIFNIGYGRAIKLKKIVKILENLHGNIKKIKLGSLPYKPNEIMYMESDNKKAKTVLGWIPKTSIEAGLTNVYNFYVRSFKNKNYDRWSNNQKIKKNFR